LQVAAIFVSATQIAHPTAFANNGDGGGLPALRQDTPCIRQGSFGSGKDQFKRLHPRNIKFAGCGPSFAWTAPDGKNPQTRAGVTRLLETRLKHLKCGLNAPTINQGHTAKAREHGDLCRKREYHFWQRKSSRSSKAASKKLEACDFPC